MATTSARPAIDGAAPPSDAEQAADAAEHLWYLFAISGVVSVVIGLLVLAYPDPSLKLFGVFLGIDLLIAGALLLIRGVSDKSDTSDGPAQLLLGTMTLIVGLVVIRNPGESVAVIALAFAIYLVVAGALAIGRGLVNRTRRWATIGRGVVLVAAGTILISWPDISLKSLVVLAGIALLLQGAIEIAEAFALRSLRRTPSTA